jgi:hypothetical protein
VQPFAAKLVEESANAKSVAGGLGMARHDIHHVRDRRHSRAVFIGLGLALWLVLGLLSQAGFQLFG